MTKPKVLIVGPTPPPTGGIAKYVLDELNSTLADSFNLSLFNTSKQGKNKNLLWSVFYLVIHLFKYPAVVKNAKPNVSHLHVATKKGFWPHVYYSAISKLFRSKVVVHVHGAEFKEFYTQSSRLGRRVISSTLNSADSVVVLSQGWFEFFSRFVNKAKLEVIENGVDTSLFKPRYTQDGKLRVLYVGSLIERKGVYDILQSIVHVTKEVENAMFVFVGDGPARRHMEQFVQDNGLSNKVEFTGELDGEEKVLQFEQADVFLLPSYAEGLPLALLEAMASSLPVVTTPVGAIPEFFKDSTNGYLVPPGDTNAFSERIISLLTSESDRREFGMRNRTLVATQFSVKETHKKLGQLFHTLSRSVVEDNDE